MSSNIFDKRVSEITTFAIDWQKHLSNANDGVADTIASAVWTTTAGVTKDSDSISGDKTLIRLSGGSAGIPYVCSCKIALTSGNDTPISFITVKVLADPV